MTLSCVLRRRKVSHKAQASQAKRMIAKAGASAEGQQDEEEDACTSGLVGAYPVHYSYLRPTFLDVLIAGAVGGFIVYYALAMF